MVSKDQIKKHYDKHKRVYNVLSIALLLTTSVLITRSIVRRSCTPQLLDVADCLGTESVDSFSFLNNTKIAKGANITTNIYNKTKGHPGFVTRCVETGELFETQNAAASFFEIPPSILSRHLNDGLELREGLHFERLGVLQ